MTATIPSNDLVTIQPVFTESERLALEGFLAGYRRLTRERPTPWTWASSPACAMRDRSAGRGQVIETLDDLRFQAFEPFPVVHVGQ
jgi:hypothetical protein